MAIMIVCDGCGLEIRKDKRGNLLHTCVSFTGWFRQSWDLCSRCTVRAIRAIQQTPEGVPSGLIFGPTGPTDETPEETPSIGGICPKCDSSSVHPDRIVGGMRCRACGQAVPDPSDGGGFGE